MTVGELTLGNAGELPFVCDIASLRAALSESGVT